ncbi:hypothetical protein PDUR_00815 [Paenibacillus durus]|uniref:Uncharacterized protein n=1 Tax=Paenibacillus durus TaxID=44251 RepID=A0A089HJ61_PAEDU|nr:hypothetical protein PDUR_00815 [Paenibacillus durus]
MKFLPLTAGAPQSKRSRRDKRSQHKNKLRSAFAPDPAKLPGVQRAEPLGSPLAKGDLGGSKKEV